MAQQLLIEGIVETVLRFSYNLEKPARAEGWVLQR
jgi:hypothetical protein